MEQGAVLALPMPTQRKDTAARKAFAKCIIKHIDEWFAFARERDLGISREDIILVTGIFDGTWRFTPQGAQGVAYNLGPSGQPGQVRLCILFLLQQTATGHG